MSTQEEVNVPVLHPRLLTATLIPDLTFHARVLAISVMIVDPDPLQALMKENVATLQYVLNQPLFLSAIQV
jgi:hypothetical protein